MLKQCKHNNILDMFIIFYYDNDVSLFVRNVLRIFCANEMIENQKLIWL